jgi:SAM-dependent methyltransferase
MTLQSRVSSTAGRVWDAVWAQNHRYGEDARRISRARHKLSLIEQHLPALSPGCCILDVGCGAAYALKAVHPHNDRLLRIGLDIAPSALARARRNPDPLLSLVNASVEQLPIKPDSVDLITAFGVLEHIRDPIPVLHAFYDILRPGGTLAVVDTHSHSTGVYERYLRQRLNIWPYGFQNEFSLPEFVGLLSRFKFDVLGSGLAHAEPDLRAVYVMDNLISKIIPDWAFYFYTVARKR